MSVLSAEDRAAAASAGGPRAPMDELAKLHRDRLATLALEGRRDAWDVLVARHDHQVLVSLLARGVRLDMAREVVQETWARLFVQYRVGRLLRLELPGLAIRQAGFLAMDKLRSPDQRAVPLAAPCRTLADPAPGADERMATREDVERAVRELDKCSARARKIFFLVYDHPEVPHAELAERAGISVQRLRQTLCEVRARLRRAIAASGKGGGHAS